MVRCPISLRGPTACFMAGWNLGANMKPMPTCSMAGDLIGREVEVEAEGGEDIRAAALGGGGAVAVLGDFASRACEDEGGGGGDVEGVRAVAACADDVVDGVG
jgi:hypothetical protein